MAKKTAWLASFCSSEEPFLTYHGRRVPSCLQTLGLGQAAFRQRASGFFQASTSLPTSIGTAQLTRPRAHDSPPTLHNPTGRMCRALARRGFGTRAWNALHAPEEVLTLAVCEMFWRLGLLEGRSPLLKPGAPEGPGKSSPIVPIAPFVVPMDRLRSFIAEVQARYLENPYHRRVSVADVFLIGQLSAPWFFAIWRLIDSSDRNSWYWSTISRRSSLSAQQLKLLLSFGAERAIITTV